jgi:excisionase family DNA binding protein
MNITQVANFLSVSKDTIYRKTSNIQIPYHKNGKRLYFKRSEIIKWIEAGKVNF